MSESNRFGKYSSDFVKFEEVGNRVEGTLLGVAEETGTSGDSYPVLKLDTHEGECRIRASQYKLKELLAVKDPQDGDWLEIELTGFEQASKGKMKIFRLDVTPNGETF
jgi:hypothetical protein